MKTITNNLTLMLLTLLSVSCASSSDYSVLGENVQNIQTTQKNTVEIECYCSNNIKIQKKNVKEITLNVIGELSSVGYHGAQKAPESVSKSILEFKVIKEGNNILLKSKEYSFMHHAFLIKNLTLVIPNNIKLKIKPLNYRQLIGRKR